MSVLNQIDFYKADHRSQYPEGTEVVFSNETPRGSRIPQIKKMVHFGLQYFIKKYLIKSWNKSFFNKPKEEVVKKYKRRIENALGKGVITYKHIEDLHDLGYLPIEIYSLPEGSRVPMRVPTMVFYNTKKEFFWLTNYLESILSCIIWGPSTSATTSYEFKKFLNHYADLTVGDRDFVKFQGHDFSFRGMFGLEAAKLSGAGHLLNFVGTDTVPAIDFLEKYYNADSDKELIGCSVAATEHSVMCMGMQDGELNTIKRLTTETYPNGIVSIVSDTWDFWQVITEYFPQLKEFFMLRDGKVVARPDSGNPVNIICGYNIINADDLNEDGKKLNIENTLCFEFGKYFKLIDKSINDYDFQYEVDYTKSIPECVAKGAVECLWEIFGGTMTIKGFKLLDSHIGLIYGDSITLANGPEIVERLRQKGFASTNIVLGIGSFTYTYVTRDTFGIAIKATYGEVNGEPRNIFKKPKTDSGIKDSAIGLLAVFKNKDGEFWCKEKATWEEVRNCEFRKVFSNGKLLIDDSLSNIRERLK